MTTSNYPAVDESELLSLHPAPADAMATTLPLEADNDAPLPQESKPRIAALAVLARCMTYGSLGG